MVVVPAGKEAGEGVCFYGEGMMGHFGGVMKVTLETELCGSSSACQEALDVNRCPGIPRVGSGGKGPAGHSKRKDGQRPRRVCDSGNQAGGFPERMAQTQLCVSLSA